MAKNTRDFADTFVAYARGEISKDEMDAAIGRLDADILRQSKQENPYHWTDAKSCIQLLNGVTPEDFIRKLRDND